MLRFKGVILLSPSLLPPALGWSGHLRRVLILQRLVRAANPQIEVGIFWPIGWPFCQRASTTERGRALMVPRGRRDRGARYAAIRLGAAAGRVSCLTRLGSVTVSTPSAISACIAA